jgi:hypothetical protein
MTIAKEEIFGPVMSIMKFKTDEEVGVYPPLISKVDVPHIDSIG